MTVVTRFAPSPTGDLHIGGARTALFNFLYARHHGGRFLLRIEDTDRARSTEAAVEAIFDGLRWLGIEWDGEPLSQFSRVERHRAVARALLDAGRAYRCYCTPKELAEMREAARKAGSGRLYDGRWRDRDPSEAPPGIDPVIRLKAPLDGETVVDDLVQGQVTVQNAQIDDFVLLRSDGTPTYMLAVVVDDHDMGITHVIRGDEHFNNAFRQAQIFRAMGWLEPAFAHIPLIHGPDGAKLSKRHGALAVQAYREMGYLPEALRNYLMRLGWGHGDDEIFPLDKAIEWFDIVDVGKGPARLDFAKLDSFNAAYLRQASDERVLGWLRDGFTARLGHPPDPEAIERLRPLLALFKERAKTIPELIENSLFCVLDRPIVVDAKAAELLTEESRPLVGGLADALASVDEWSADALEPAVKAFAEARGLKLGKVAQPMRAALTGRSASPGIYDVLLALGREESLGRLRDAAQN